MRLSAYRNLSLIFFSLLWKICFSWCLLSFKKWWRTNWRISRHFLYFYFRRRRLQRLENKQRKKKRQFWFQDISLQRHNFGIFNILYQELKYDSMRKLLLLPSNESRTIKSSLVFSIWENFEKALTRFRKSISAEESLICNFKVLSIRWKPIVLFFFSQY